MSELILQNISKTYNPGLFKKKVRAVSDLSLEVDKGEIYGLIGPNGAGKSTTIRLLLGLIRPDSGTVLFRGKELAKSGIQKEIGYLPENPYLYDHLNLDEILRFCGRTSGLDASATLRRADRLLEKLDMSSARRRPLRTFSKGMLQRAGICFALLHDPSVVILDEPMSGLDPIGRKLVFDLVMELKGQGKTIFFCSHILSDVERLCDRIGVLVSGKLVRQFNQSEFRDDEQRPVHLLTGSLSDEQRDVIGGLGVKALVRHEETLLSVAPDRFAELVAALAEMGVEIHGSRGERVSLEELFLDTVREQAS